MGQWLKMALFWKVNFTHYSPHNKVTTPPHQLPPPRMDVFWKVKADEYLVPLHLMDAGIKEASNAVTEYTPGIPAWLTTHTFRKQGRSGDLSPVTPYPREHIVAGVPMAEACQLSAMDGSSDDSNTVLIVTADNLKSTRHQPRRRNTIKIRAVAEAVNHHSSDNGGDGSDKDQRCELATRLPPGVLFEQDQ